VSDFPNVLKLTAGGVPSEGRFLGFATVSAVSRERPTVRFDHCGIPLRMVLDRKFTGVVENGQLVVIRYDPQDQFVNELWTLRDLRPLLTPPGE
jgi:hypothetical protein